MGNRVPIQLGKKPGKDSAPMNSVERVVNGYVKLVPEGKQQTPVYGTPGLISWCTGLNAAVRGWRYIKGVLWVVGGTGLYSVSSAGVETYRGDIPGTELVTMAGDGTNVVVVADGGEIYVWNGTVVAAVTDPDAPDASWVEWQDGYFIFGTEDSDEWFICALDDPTNYDALDFTAAEWQPDNLYRGISVRRTLWLFGVDTVEAAQNVGGADFPFARYDDIFIDVGLAGIHAVTHSNDAIFFLASDKTVRRIDGLSAVPISDDYVKTIIEGWSDVSATVASAHIWENRLMIGFRNPDGAIFYDQSTERWHERKSQGSDTTLYRQILPAYGKVLCASASEGTIYYYDKDTFTEDGAVLPFEVVTPFVYANGSPFSLDEVEVVAQTGVGSLTVDPKLSLEISEDGETWGIRQERGLGKTGERQPIEAFGAQGTYTAAALKLSISGDCRRAILGIFAEVDVDL